MPHQRALLLPLFSILAACERAPTEPRAAISVVPPARPAEPSLELAARAVSAAADAAVAQVYAIGVPTPAGARAVSFTMHGNIAAALIDAERAWIGRDGAERALASWGARGEVPDAPGLARLIGAMVYPGCRVMLGGEALALGDGGSVRGPAPALGPHPGGGRVLTFAFVIPEGQGGAGLHVARWRWTDSGLLIEASPHPERR
jgi:hypothetical protein